MTVLFDVLPPEFCPLKVDEFTECAWCGSPQVVAYQSSVGSVCGFCQRVVGCREEVHRVARCDEPSEWSAQPANRVVARCEDCRWLMHSARVGRCECHRPGALHPRTEEAITAAVVAHELPLHVTRWGESHEPGECLELHSKLKRRRVAYINRKGKQR